MLTVELAMLQCCHNGSVSSQELHTAPDHNDFSILSCKLITTLSPLIAVLLVCIYRRTQMALQTWNTLTTNASTPSTVLPLNSDELMRQLRVRERWGKLVGSSKVTGTSNNQSADSTLQDYEVGGSLVLPLSAD